MKIPSEMSMEMTISIPNEEYWRLISEHIFLSALRAAGVESWEGYKEAVRMEKEYYASNATPD